MRNQITFISRILVGALFIVSGLIKANDPLGFSYKLEEYFAQDALNWSIFHGAEVGLAMAACIGEIILGVALLAGEKIKLAIWSTLLLMIFFTFLTGYTAIGNWFFENQDAGLTKTFEGILGFTAADIHYFKDCGCFGDALKLTPMQSFLKDVVLMVFTLLIFFDKNNVKSNTSMQDYISYGASIVLIALFSWGVLGWGLPVWFSLIVFAIMMGVKMLIKSDMKSWAMAGITTIISFMFTYHCYAHLPVKDFRPYAIGRSISDGMKSAEELGLLPPKYGYIYTLKNKNTGELKEIDDQAYLNEKWWEKKEWEMVSELTKHIKIRDGYEPPVHDFVLESMESGDDQTNWALTQPYIMFWVEYDLSKTDKEVQSEVVELTKAVEELNVPVWGLTAGLYDQVEAFRHKHQLMFPYYTCDATTLKTVIRSNPGLVLLNKGTVIGKWHSNDIPSIEEIQELIN